MSTFGVVIIIVIIGSLIGGLLVLRNSAKTGMPSKDVLERAQRHARDLDAQEKARKDQDD